MSTLSVTNINTANGTTDLSLKTGNSSGPVLVVGAGSNIAITNTTNILVGSNVNITTDSLNIGNSTVNSIVNSTSLSVPTRIVVGNSTVNSIVNSTSLSVPTTIVVGNSTVNTIYTSSNITVGANISINTSSIFAGNSSVNTNISNGVLVINGSNISPVQSFRNKIINGGMSIDQRNSGASQTFTAAAALAYCVDRWYGYCTGANVTGARVAGSSQSQHRYQFTGAASVTAIGFGQRIEALNSYGLNNTTATLSVDLANSLLTTVTWTAYYANTADTFGTLASPTRTQIATGTFTVTSTVTRYTTQIAIPSNATTGIEIVFTVGAQTSGTWTIGNVQLEPGSVATPFEVRPYGLEFAMCQRYYQTVAINAYAVNANYTSFNPDFYYPVTFPVTLRASPTVTRTGVADSGVTGGIVSATTSGFSVVMELTAASGQSVFTAVAAIEL